MVRNEALKVVDPSLITVDGEPLDHPGTLVIALHKPVNFVCSHDDREGPSVYELLPDRWLERNPRVESVGRLDRDTSGLLLLTDDHQLLHRLTSPRHHVPKRYVATLDVAPGASVADVFGAGMLVLDGESTACLPATLAEIGPLEYSLTLYEGRYHQVRRMFAAVDCHVMALIRTEIGPLELGLLEAGTHRVLSVDEIGALTNLG